MTRQTAFSICLGLVLLDCAQPSTSPNSATPARVVVRMDDSKSRKLPVFYSETELKDRPFTVIRDMSLPLPQRSTDKPNKQFMIEMLKHDAQFYGAEAIIFLEFKLVSPTPNEKGIVQYMGTAKAIKFIK